jgi:hypothetical protein
MTYFLTSLLAAVFTAIVFGVALLGFTLAVLIPMSLARVLRRRWARR